MSVILYHSPKGEQPAKASRTGRAQPVSHTAQAPARDQRAAAGGGAAGRAVSRRARPPNPPAPCSTASTTPLLCAAHPWAGLGWAGRLTINRRVGGCSLHPADCAQFILGLPCTRSLHRREEAGQFILTALSYFRSSCCCAVRKTLWTDFCLSADTFL